MAQEPDAAAVAAEAGVDVTDHQPPSPTASTSSREETRATREKLKKTSIAGLSAKLNPNEPLPPTDTLADSTPSMSDLASETQNGIRGRPAKKRSFEDLTKDDADADATSSVAQPPLPKSGHHKRMRSRDVNSGDQSQAYTRIEADPENTLHEETDVDAQAAPGGPGVLVDAPSQEEMDSDKTTHLSQTGLSSTADTTEAAPSTTTQIPPSSGFANASSASPFSAVKSPTKQQSDDSQRPASTSAFASSGLSAFASSEKSPFGAAAGTKSPLGVSGGFGSATSSGGFASAKSTFGSAGGFSAATPSAFGASTAGFGSAKGFGTSSTSSAFGAPKPFGMPSSTFGNPSTSAFGSSKPFGASKGDDHEDDDDENEGDEDAASTANDDAQQDPRFREQQIDTGETDEEPHFTSRARLYFFEGSWKERGTGNLKVNVSLTAMSPNAEQDDPEAQSSGFKRKARLLMRADATHRVLLNSPIFKGMRFGAPDGSEPTGKIMHLQSLEEGKAVPLQIKIGKEEVLKDLYYKLKELENEA